MSDANSQNLAVLALQFATLETNMAQAKANDRQLELEVAAKALEIAVAELETAATRERTVDKELELARLKAGQDDDTSRKRPRTHDDAFSDRTNAFSLPSPITPGNQFTPLMSGHEFNSYQTRHDTDFNSSPMTPYQARNGTKPPHQTSYPPNEGDSNPWY